ncbi:MAG: tetratricopeptide repeat protein, partial [Kangiellaceae bacterium]
LFTQFNDQPDVWLKALLFLKSNSRTSLNDFLNIALERFPNNYEFINLSARNYYELGNFELSVAQIEKIPPSKMRSITFQLAGLSYQKIDEHQKAIESYQNILIDAPLRGDINMAIGISYEKLKQTENAAKYFSIALNDTTLNIIQREFIKQRLVAYQG